MYIYLHICIRIGSYLLSGGNECVLVKWQTATGHNNFLPRLGAPISLIACSHDNGCYAICHVDNGKSLYMYVNLSLTCRADGLTCLLFVGLMD